MGVTIKKYLPSEQATIPGIDSWGGKDFLPIYNVYVDDRRIGQYTNEYDAVKEAFRQYDVNEIQVAYDNDPNSFSSVSLGHDFHYTEEPIENLLKDVLLNNDKMFKSLVQAYVEHNQESIVSNFKDQYQEIIGNVIECITDVDVLTCIQEKVNEQLENI